MREEAAAELGAEGEISGECGEVRGSMQDVALASIVSYTWSGSKVGIVVGVGRVYS
jgi:hypothetical protein